MNVNMINYPIREYEIVERKGKGHPDTIADDLAEFLSREYSKYTRDRFGAVLHHNFDKVGLMGGMTKVEFGKTKLINPIRVLLNGRATGSFGSESIPVRDLLEEKTKCFLKNRLKNIDVSSDIRILYEVSSGSSPGAVGDESSYRRKWFAPQNLSDLSELKTLNCNDTSLGAAFYHKNVVEKSVYDIEHKLNSDSFKNKYPWIGSDIKLMGCRIMNDIHITMAIPQLAEYVGSIREYKNNKEFLYDYIYDELKGITGGYNLSIDINTRDRFNDSVDLYLTMTGSSIEMGDEGFVGRGNRIGGLITPFRPYTMEGICGKNPIYHTGKVYCVAAYEISRKIYEHTGVDSNVLLIGQSGKPLNRPWNLYIVSNEIITNDCNEYINEVLGDFSLLSDSIINGEFILC